MAAAEQTAAERTAGGARGPRGPGDGSILSTVRRELRFLLAIWRTGLASAMEYRAAFLTQVLGMALNNLIFLTFWVVFFTRFDQVQGWGLGDVTLLFAVVATGFGLAVFLFGNALNLGEVISGGRLDYYLAMPRPVLLHALAGNSRFSGVGDVLSGLLIFLVVGDVSALSLLRFGVGVLSSAAVLLSFLVTVQSLTFWMGGASLLSQQAFNAIVTFATYPLTLFDGSAKLLLLTIVPAAFVGAVPASLVQEFSWTTLGQMALSATVSLVIALVVFHRGLRRYESGSAIVVGEV